MSDLQARLREGVEQEQAVQWRLRRLGPSDDQVKMELAKIRADVLALADELSYVFEAIRLAQDKMEGNSDQKSALLLLAFSQEMSWRMLDARRELLAKLSVKNVKFSWLSRQDSSIVSRLRVGDLHAFDGSANATWSEILRKHNEPSSHPLVKVCSIALSPVFFLTFVKRDLFALSNWTVLAPVGRFTEFHLAWYYLRLYHQLRRDQHLRKFRSIASSYMFATGHEGWTKNNGIHLARQETPQEGCRQKLGTTAT